ncbi:hypothetical protein V2J09_007385 [Rumex salicifolius]
MGVYRSLPLYSRSVILRARRGPILWLRTFLVKKMAAWTAVARQAGQLSRLTSPKIANANPQAFSVVHRRGLAGGGDHHGPPKVNCWSDPMSPSKWKEEHFVIVSLSGWGLLIYSGYKFFTGGKKDIKELDVVCDEDH